MPGREFSIRRRVQFAETDLAGIAHFSNFFRWMEETEHAFFRSLGMSIVMHHGDAEITWPRVAAQCDYSGPVRFEDELELRLRVAKLGAKSLTFEFSVLKDGERVARGKMTSVCCTIDGGTMRSLPIPADIRAKLEAGTNA
jgi:YbgC/YbaW family acyl-CoA thioester hydrolase